jgi:hypothetical protein
VSNYLPIEHFCDHQRHLPPAATHSVLVLMSEAGPTVDGLADGVLGAVEGTDVEGAEPGVGSPVVLGAVPVLPGVEVLGLTGVPGVVESLGVDVPGAPDVPVGPPVAPDPVAPGVPLPEPPVLPV